MCVLQPGQQTTNQRRRSRRSSINFLLLVLSYETQTTCRTCAYSRARVVSTSVCQYFFDTNDLTVFSTQRDKVNATIPFPCLVCLRSYLQTTIKIQPMENDFSICYRERQLLHSSYYKVNLFYNELLWSFYIWLLACSNMTLAVVLKNSKWISTLLNILIMDQIIVRIM